METLGIMQIMRIHHQGKTDICIEFHGNPSSTCQGILLDDKNVKILKVPKENSRFTKVNSIQYLTMHMLLLLKIRWRVSTDAKCPAWFNNI